MRRSVRTWWSTDGASAWCLTFAALHIYWAVGGELGLASSAGSALAARRPALFVVVGLWGTAMLLLLGAALSAALAREPIRLRRLMTATAWLVGAALLTRGVVLELVLATGAGGISASVGTSQTYWGLVLWNPWFILGGIAFLLAARRERLAHRARSSTFP